MTLSGLVGKARSLASILLLSMFISACQPSPTERIESAEGYIAEGNYPAAVLEIKNALRAEPENATARALLADASYQMADFATSVEEYSRAIGLGADTEANWVGLGQSLLRTGRSTEAFERVLPNLDTPTASDDAVNLQAEIYTALGRYDQATSLFEQTADGKGKSERGRIGLAIVLAAQSRHQEALDLLDNITASEQASSRAWQVMGNYLNLRGQSDRARFAYEESIDRETLSTPIADRFETRSALVVLAIDRADLNVARSRVTELESLFPMHPMLRYLRGRIAFAAGDMETAATELQQYLAVLPNDPQAHAVMGAISFSQNHYSQAEMYLRQAVRGNVGGDTLRRLLAETRLRLNRPGEALEILDDDVDTTDPVVLELLGRAEYGAGNREQAIEYFRRGIDANPGVPDSYLSFAAALLSNGDNEKAIETLTNMPDGVDSDYRREMMLVLALARNDDLESAIELSETMLSDNPQRAGAHAFVGSFKRGIGKLTEAEAHFERAIQIDPSNSAALLGVAQLAIENSDLARAERMLETLLDVNPGHEPALRSLSSIMIADGRAAQLMPILDAAVAAAPNQAGLLLLQAKGALAFGDARRALEIARTLRNADPDLAAAHHIEGLALLANGQNESALLSLARAVTSDDGNLRFRFDLARARLNSGDFYGAIETIEDVRARAPDALPAIAVHVNALLGLNEVSRARAIVNELPPAALGVPGLKVLRGDIEMADRNVGEAVRLFEEASDTVWDRGLALRLSGAYLAADSAKAAEPLARWLAEHPNDVEVRRSYGQLLQASGDNAGAVEEYEKVLSDNANDPVALNNLAWEYIDLNPGRALELSQRAYELMPEHGSIADTYGWILHLNGKPNEALPLLRKAAELSPNNGEVKYHLAKVLVSVGKTEEASSILQALLAGDPQFPSLRDAQTLAKTL